LLNTVIAGVASIKDADGAIVTDGGKDVGITFWLQ